MRFFRKMGNGASASSSSSQQQQSGGGNGRGGSSGGSRHVYPGQRTVVRGNALQRRSSATAVGATVAGTAGAAGPVTTTTYQVAGAYPTGAPATGGVVGPSAAGAAHSHQTALPPGMHQQVLADGQGRRVVRYTQHATPPASGSAGTPHAPTQHHQQQRALSLGGGQTNQIQRNTLMGPAGNLGPGSIPTAAGGGIIQQGLNPGLGGSVPLGLGGAGSPMTQLPYQHQLPQQPQPLGGGGAGPGGGAGGAAPQAQTLSGPGAYSISRNDAGPTQVFRVAVPPGVAPNQEFQVYAGSRVVRVRCPPDTRPGQSLQITVPPDPVVRQNLLGMAVLTSVDGGEGGGAVAMREEIRGRNEGLIRTEREREERRGRETRERATGAAGSRRGSTDTGSSEVGSGSGGDGDVDNGGGGGGGGGGTGDEEDSQGTGTGSSAGADAGADGADEESGLDEGPNPAVDQEESSTAPPPPQQQTQPPQPPPQPQAYMVTVPPGVRPGGHFPVMVAGQQLMVQCPHNARPGMNVRIIPPVIHQQQQHQPGMQSGTSLDRPPEQGGAGGGAEGPPRQQLTTQMFEVIVPAGVRPNQPFALIAGGQRVLVTCPPNAYPGQRIRFQLPVSQPSAKSIESVKLSYDGMQDGWIRTVRVTDMKFQWVRMDDKGDVDTDVRFDIRHSAYVRKLVFLEGNDPRMRTGFLSLVPASEAAVDSRVVAPGPSSASGGREIVGYADLAAAQGRRYDDKARWFHDVCARLTTDWNEGHMRITIRRPFLLQDSMNAVMSLGRDDLRKIWRFEFMGEAGIDAGGLAREWFHLVSEQIFDPDNGLWMSSSGSQQMYMRINPASEISCPEDHLVYFRFLGRVMGKALFDRQLVTGHMVRHMYKHILGWPIGFDDLELFDEDYYKHLKKLAEYDDISVMCLSFTVVEDALGVKRELELIPGGADVEVTNDNLPEFLEANLKYRMLDRIRPQLTELLLGFFDVIPEPLLTIFDYQELELLMCGLPEINVDDWIANTNYTGNYEGVTANGPSLDELPSAARWFWEVVRNDFDQETRARLLQFVTGTSGVPSRGFSVLQGNDGNIRKFTIHGVDPAHYHYPRAHTCFNRIDLPMYTTKEELLEKLRVAVATSATGFDIE